MKDDVEFNKKFIRLMEQHSCLYDFNSTDYNDKNQQEKAWEEISAEVNETATECKQRWRAIRGSFSRYIKYTRVPSDKLKKKYYLAKYLTFLRPYIKSREPNKYLDSPPRTDAIYLNSNDFDDENKSEEDSLSQKYFDSDILGDKMIMEPILKKPDALMLDNFSTSAINTEIIDDPDLCFLKSILPDMKEMDSDQKRKFKIGVLNLTNEILSYQT